MFENLEAFSKRQAELMQKMADPSVLSDPDQYASLMKEYRELSPIVDKYEQYCRLERAYEEAKELFESSSGDRDMRELASEEMQICNIGKYVITDIAEADEFLIKNYDAKGELSQNLADK